MLNARVDRTQRRVAKVSDPRHPWTWRKKHSSVVSVLSLLFVCDFIAHTIRSTFLAEESLLNKGEALGRRLIFLQMKVTAAMSSRVLISHAAGQAIDGACSATADLTKPVESLTARTIGLPNW